MKAGIGWYLKHFDTYKYTVNMILQLVELISVPVIDDWRRLSDDELNLTFK